jgi:hypothetical protein
MAGGQPTSNITLQNSFIGGLKTEFTGLNFPENACTSMENTIISLIGESVRREGIDFESGFDTTTIDRTNKAISTYKWKNVGGDGQTQILVMQVGNTLYFYQSSNSTIADPLSDTILASTVTISNFTAAGATFNAATECQYADGNGFLFVFHPNIDPIYCSFNAGVITAAVITVRIRDFAGIPEMGVGVNQRPTALTSDHKYNLLNQGWGGGATNFLSTTSLSFNSEPTTLTFTVASALPINSNDSVYIASSQATQANGAILAYGTVSSYTGTTLVITPYALTSWGVYYQNTTFNSWVITDTGVQTGFINYITYWNTQSSSPTVGTYPSNADVWWYFLNTASPPVFSPKDMVNSVTLSNAPAPQGHFILDAFTQNRSSVSGVPGLTNINTTVRPRTGAFFQGRVWYAGVDAAQQATGDAPYYTWTENIYFSQIIENNDINQFGQCYQINDPTSMKLFSLLPSDGGVITIQGSGAIYKLFPIANGILVFAANGIWFITGGSGLGFTATDYVVSKISAVQAISGTSFIDVLGYPFFWNTEGIYEVSMSQQHEGVPYGHGGLVVRNICLGTILSFYNTIPLTSKIYARGDYNPITFVLSWVYKTAEEVSVTDRYQFDGVLNLNMANRAFYPYSITGTTPKIHDVKYIYYPAAVTAPNPDFKYLSSYPSGGSYKFTFAEEIDSVNWKDFYSYDNTGVDYVSFFTTGYAHRGAMRKWGIDYIYMYSRNNVQTSYTIQSLFDFAISGTSGKESNIQVITNNESNTSLIPSPSNFNMLYRRHRLRGHGNIFQFTISSVSGQPFDIMGWAMFEELNESVG